MATEKIDFGNGEVLVNASTKALMIYEHEFDSDLIQDLFKRVVIRANEDDENVLAALDFRNTNWTSLVKTLWATMKAADDTVPTFNKWMDEVGDVDLFAINNELMPVIERGLFRSGAAATE